jgi:hypothetical protein
MEVTQTRERESGRKARTAVAIPSHQLGTRRRWQCRGAIAVSGLCPAEVLGLTPDAEGRFACFLLKGLRMLCKRVSDDGGYTNPSTCESPRSGLWPRAGPWRWAMAARSAAGCGGWVRGRAMARPEVEDSSAVRLWSQSNGSESRARNARVVVTTGSYRFEFLSGTGCTPHLRRVQNCI